MKLTSVVALSILAMLAAGCEDAPPVRTPVSSVVRVGEPAGVVTRSIAVDTARTDAVARYGSGWIASVDAQQYGRFWVVELRASNGKGLRYTISTADGGIKQRNLFQ
jgi:hypothetical protein